MRVRVRNPGHPHLDYGTPQAEAQHSGESAQHEQEDFDERVHPDPSAERRPVREQVPLTPQERLE